jgi:hypothetical protein
MNVEHSRNLESLTIPNIAAEINFLLMLLDLLIFINTVMD